MTLLIAGTSVPAVREADLLNALLDRWDDVFAFFLSFAVIGFYWLAHHAFFALLSALDERLVRMNLFYLGFIALLPFRRRSSDGTTVPRSPWRSTPRSRPWPAGSTP
jgi:uncharacterized membrane protein